MPVNYVYTPIVKGKANDFKAVANLTSGARAAIKPLIELLPVPAESSIDPHLIKFADNIANHLPSGEIFVDFYGLLPGDVTRDGANAVATGFHMLVDRGRVVTPAYGFDRDDAVWTQLRSVVKRMNCGFCFRIDIDDLDDQAEDTWSEIIERASELKIVPAQADLLIDLRDIRQMDTAKLKGLVVDFLSLKPPGDAYRSIILAGSSALKTVADIPKDGVGEISQRELRLWMQLQSDLAGSTELTYADYGIVHPEFSDAGPNKNANAKIRYTKGAKFVIFRGHKLYDPSDFKQYHVLADRVRSSNQYEGRKFSFGDRYIDDCASYILGPGNLGNWVLADMNHHLEYTTKQVANLLQKVTSDLSEDEIEE
ncbi:MAG: beta family protein [Methylococcales bacterium]